ncbi:MAG: hypothetical protein DMG90_04850 [Acidobacteria bacterium]|nr:MAG: hypothetical protein DMG90_04850 [Acidobacteriota bacterium]
MQPHDLGLQALAERVVKLETQNRRLKKAGIAVILLVSVPLFMGQAETNRVVEANAFHLMDASGKIRAQLSMEMSGPTLSLLDAGGSPVVSLAGGDQPVLVLNRPGTTEQIQLGTNKIHFGLGLYDKQIRASLSIENGTPGIDLFDESGTAQATLVARPTGSFLRLRNPAGKEISTLWVDSSAGGSSFNMGGSAGSLSVNLGEEAGGPGIEITDNEGFSTVVGRRETVGTSVKERKPAASLLLLGKDRRVLWAAP